MSVEMLLSLYISNCINFNNTNAKIVEAIKIYKKRQQRLRKILQFLDQKHCRVWSYPKNLTWWQSIVPQFTHAQWKAAFRVEKSTFDLVLSKVRRFLQKRDTNYRKCIPVEKRVAVCFFILGSSAELRTVSQLFGIEKSTLCRMLHAFCSCMVKCFLKSEIAFPSSDGEVLTLVNNFKTNYDFPQCFGAIDGTHIEVSPPTINDSFYYNYKCFYSLVLLAVCDSNYRFWYVNVSCPGRNNDAFVYKTTRLCKFLKYSNLKFRNCAKKVNNSCVPPVILGDGAFPLQTNLMKPFSDINLNLVQENFNERLGRARFVVEGAFLRLKGRFRLLGKRNEFKIDNVPNMVKTCCILHNICENQNDKPRECWLEDVVLLGDNTTSVVGNCNEAAMNIRQNLANYLYH